jgi:hypothetical protein
MKTKILFLKMMWRVITNKEQGWIFFKVGSYEQQEFINNGNPINIDIRYLGVDNRVINIFKDRIENSLK